ncbi:hypothetical protein CGRA01v4_04434 [Colletotrichum graminicola]|nr:hypothetical protein CGRA01v4_04434 [Colletotrichum graminicola]
MLSLSLLLSSSLSLPSLSMNSRSDDAVERPWNKLGNPSRWDLRARGGPFRWRSGRSSVVLAAPSADRARRGRLKPLRCCEMRQTSSQAGRPLAFAAVRDDVGTLIFCKAASMAFRVLTRRGPVYTSERLTETIRRGRPGQRQRDVQ